MRGRLASSCKKKGREEKGWEKGREVKGPRGERGGWGGGDGFPGTSLAKKVEEKKNKKYSVKIKNVKKGREK